LRNGPVGGNVNDVATLNKIIVSTDSTLADAYSASVFGKDPMSVSYIREAANRNFGNADYQRAEILKIKI